MSAYCPTCRTHYQVDANPPYAAMHMMERRTYALTHVTVEVAIHRHPITRELLEESNEVRPEGGALANVGVDQAESGGPVGETG